MQGFVTLYYLIVEFFSSDWLANFIFHLQIISGIVSAILLVIIIILARKTNMVRAAMQEVKEFVEEPAQEKIPEIQDVSAEWGKVAEKLHSAQPSDWKVAIIEADNLLDHILQQMRIPGEDMGGRLKSLSTDQLNNLDAVWRMHKLRNELAHNFASEVTPLEVRQAEEVYQQALRYLGAL